MKMEEIKKQLKELLSIHFSHPSFRPGQEKAIDSILNKQDTIVVLPTGGGKSIIYQLPALVLEGITIVISPLISLMKDQVDSLDKSGIPATLINSSISPLEVKNRLERMENNEYKLVYIAPERFYNQEFIYHLKKIKVALMAIDEAHCISQWGHDFRPSYLRLKEIIKFLNKPPVLALTATATREVRADIAKQLDLKNPNLIIGGFARPNLRLAASSVASGKKLSKLIEIFSGPDLGSGIIYVGTKAKAGEIVEKLTQENIKALEYHAGLDPSSRSWVQEQFMQEKVQVIVATNAFGLGINKKNIRFVFHYDLPGTLEAYYQEAGRAGRDGRESICLLLNSPTDRYLQEFFIQGDNPSLETVIDVYQYLLKLNQNKEFSEDSLLITYQEIVKNISENVPEMAIGTALKILEKESFITRPNEKTTNSYLKLNINYADGFAEIGNRARKQKGLLIILQERFEKEMQKGWFFVLDELATIIKWPKNSLNQALKKLAERKIVDYKPPFRGTEIRLKKIAPAAELFKALDYLEEKTSRSYEKLDLMEAYVHTTDCRQAYILKYFGETQDYRCGRCDNCLLDKSVKNYLGNY